MQPARWRPGSLRNRFILYMALMLLPLMLLGLVTGHGQFSMVATLANVSEEVEAQVEVIGSLQVLVAQTPAPVTNFLAGGDPEERRNFRLHGQLVRAEFERALAASFPSPEDEQRLNEAYSEWWQANSIGEGIVSTPDLSRNFPDLRSEAFRMRLHVQRSLEALNDMHRSATARIAGEVDTGKTTLTRYLITTALILLGGMLIAGLTAWSLVGSVLKPLAALEEGAHRIREGSLSYRVSLNRRDELGRLAITFNSLASKLEADETRRARDEATIRYLAYHDPLTELPNRTLFTDRLHMALAHAERAGERLAVLLIDLDEFKSVNDSLGHPAGDRLLQQVAARLRRSVRKEDTVARLGGDEFTLLLPHLREAEDAVGIAHKIIEGFRDPWLLEGRTFAITPSIGIAVYPDHARDADSLLLQADRAMYLSKPEGNTYRFPAPA